MSAAETPLKVVIAADTAMNRDVVRFFLQASGDIEVIGQAASAGDASWMAKKYAVDAVVIHAGIAFDATQDAVRRVRKAAPAARIVVVTPEGGGVPLPMSSRGADSYLEEGVGLAELAFVLVSLCRSPDIAIDVQPAFDRRPGPDPVVVLPQPESELVFAGASGGGAQGALLAAAPDIDAPGPATSTSWRGGGGLVPLLAAAAAFVMVVGLTMYRTQVEDMFAPRGTAYFAGVHIGPPSSVMLLASEERLDDLVHSLDGARIMNAPAIARDLVERRSQIVDAGDDVSALDREIEATLRPILATSPPGIAVAVLTVLAPVAEWASADLDSLLLGDPSPSPGAQGSHEPSPSGAGPTGAHDGVPSSGDGPTGGAEAVAGTGGSGASEGSTHDDGSGGAGGDDGTGGGSGDGGGGTGDGGGGSGSGDGGGSGSGDGGGSGDGDGGGEDGSGEDGDGEGGGDQGGDGDGDEGEDDQGTGGEDGAGGGDEACDHPGNGGGHGYGHCDGHGGGNDDRGDGEDPNSGGGNNRAAHLLTGSILLLGARRPRR